MGNTVLCWSFVSGFSIRHGMNVRRGPAAAAAAAVTPAAANSAASFGH